MRFFATGMINTVMDKMSVPDDQPIEAKMVSKAIERAQSQVESQNFEIRKNLLKYDEVLSKQREEVYRARRSLLEGEDLSERAEQMLGDVIEDTIAMLPQPGSRGRGLGLGGAGPRHRPALPVEAVRNLRRGDRHLRSGGRGLP